VQREDGEVRAANRDGGGAEFTITIPVQPAPTRVASV